MRRLLFFLKVGGVWLNFGHSLQKKVGKTKELSHAFDVVDEFFSKPGLKYTEKTELRY